VGNKAIRADRHQLADKDVGLDAGTIADDSAALDLDEGADKTIVPNETPVEINRFDDRDSFPEGDVLDACLTKRRLISGGWRRRRRRRRMMMMFH
jgi:hypothetical protein